MVNIYLKFTIETEADCGFAPLLAGLFQWERCHFPAGAKGAPGRAAHVVAP